MSDGKVYRVIVTTTGRLQARGTIWSRELVYVGLDMRGAHEVFAAERERDFIRGVGRPARKTEIEVIDHNSGGTLDLIASAAG